MSEPRDALDLARRLLSLISSTIEILEEDERRDYARALRNGTIGLFPSYPLWNAANNLAADRHATHAERDDILRAMIEPVKQ